MALIVELVIVLATKPFSLFKLSCLFGVRSLCIVIQTWIELLRAAVYFHLIMIWKVTIWAISILSLPMRLLTALKKERQLEMHLHEMEKELENIAWDRKELREQLQMAIKEHRTMEMILAELEDEHDEAIVKIELLEGELQDLKDENRLLKEAQCKYLWNHRDRGDNSKICKDGGKYGISPWKSNYNGSGVNGHRVKNVWEEEDKIQTEKEDIVKAEPEAWGSIHQYAPVMVSRNSDVGNFVDQSREIAVSRSLFSAILSILVGMIVWEAKDPCMPLVVALFTVVGMSLKSVVEFFSTIKNKPASDAVALLSFNWFILGTLTYPMLPRVACTLAPSAMKVLERALRLLGLSL